MEVHMTEIPEHLLKRAEEAKAKAAAKKQGAAPAAEAAANEGATTGDAGIESATGSSGIPAHLLERSRAAKERAGGGGVATQAPPTAAGAVARPSGPAPAVGPAGHTQR